jgi:Domain of unknown function (DUF1707)
MATGPDLRIGDAEREAAANLLREHYAQGRLTLEEFNQRLDATFAATTQRQLGQISRDLPHPGLTAATRPQAARAGQRQDHSRRGNRSAPRILRLVPVMVAVATLWLLTVGLHLSAFPWPGRLAIFVAVLAFARGIMRWIWRQASGARSRPHARGQDWHGPRWGGPCGGRFGPGGSRRPWDSDV